MGKLGSDPAFSQEPEFADGVFQEGWFGRQFVGQNQETAQGFLI
jgi:hypothetical protein